MLRELPRELSKLIKSQQYIHDLYIIVKELVENSLDASATRIKIIITDTSVTVEDNGHGINDLDSVCKPGFTSKESTSYHVLGITQSKPEFTHGFRGQALSAISMMCDVEILTKTPEEDILGTYKNFTTTTVEKRPRETGTTVKITNIFKDCPIRKEHYRKTTRKSLSRIISFLNAYLYVYDIHFILLYNNTVFFDETGSSNTREYSLLKHHCDRNNEFLDVSDSKFNFILFPLDKSDVQVILVEKRVCKFEKVSGIIKSIFKMYFDHNPTFILTISDECDVNLSADKTEVILKNCKYVENKIKSEMDRYFALKHFVDGNEPDVTTRDVLEIKERIDDSIKVIPIENYTQCINHIDKSIVNEENGIKCFINEENKVECFIDEENKVECCKNEENEIKCCTNERNGIKCCINEENEIKCCINEENEINCCTNEENEINCCTNEENEINCCTNEENEINCCKNNNEENDKINEIFHYTPQSQPNYIKNRIQPKSIYNILEEETMGHSSFVLDKEDFKATEIIGQFNQGFILCTLKKNEKKFLIVVDQHAADEIYNYEKLKKSFRLKTQRLLNPIKLNLSPIQNLLVEEYGNILYDNGFKITDGELHTIPTYQGIFFTVDDLYSLIEDLSNGITFTDKYRRIIASKACRSSIMIGEALRMKDMRRIIDNLSSLDLPWNCPHGRPTFKVLTEL